ncbi:VIT1/CCC1 transporter family protein [Yinghuangia sp. ASG 101]|uniref:VIT1/CCC1 transporter family protein n=1 Tax=Yinghuangia sp. ASG 101 TaxID=2896848 RepID=UPI001E2D77C2|nr:VIT1/CCC1 transporter family protein [Yinghuangia sp. ASG 101]UGQ10108.1 VIT1/CCC1 transporter family protein [Yinghuangia sp. ASG 101]
MSGTGGARDAAAMAGASARPLGSQGTAVHDGGEPQIDHSHRDIAGGWLRPAVFGAMDGLVSNSALIAGVAGSNATASTIAITGLAGLAGGAFSMAAGEYTSVASQGELAQAEVEVERRELVRAPEAERHELAELYIARGLDEKLAHEVAAQLSRDPDQALEIHAREELGVDPHDLPSPWLAAGASFAAFAVGAILPLLPYLLGATSLWPAIILTLTGLFVAGAAVSHVTAKPWWFGGLRQLLLGTVAGGLTYLLGMAIGQGIG